MNCKRLAAFFSIQLICLCQYSLALARAGGGHSSRSSSSSGGHSLSSGPSSWGGSSSHSSGYFFAGTHSSSADSGGWFVFLIIAIVIVIAIILLVIWSRRNNTGLSEAGGISRGVAPDVHFAPDLAAKIDQLKVRDPGFNEQIFQDKISTIFFVIENAWAGRDMNPARLYLSDSVYSRFHLQLEEYVRNHTFNRLDELSLDKAEILDIRSDENYDTINIWITATAKDYVVDENGKVVSGSPALATWDEQWSLTRSVKAITRIKDGVSVVKCPNCGAPLEINAAGECVYCHAVVNKYDFDWVLTEIEQLNIP